MPLRTKIRKRALAAVVSGSALLAGVIAAGPAASAEVVRPATPTVGVRPAQSTGGVLFGVSAHSAHEMWAVGYTGLDTLIEHSTGHAWTQQPSPNPATAYQAQLQSVSAVSANNVWAVGFALVGGKYGVWSSLIEHYTKAAGWTIVPSPTPTGATGTFLEGVSAVSASDVWAVGEGSLVENWNGHKWTIVPIPTPSGAISANLYAVDAVSADDVWAVGHYQNSNYDQETLIEQWNGTSWSIVPSPNPPGGSQSTLYGVSAVSASDVWAAGEYYNPSTGDDETLTEQWNGTSWSIVPSPNPKDAQAQLFGVTATPSGGAWAVGYAWVGSTNSSLIEEWTGTKWKIARSPQPPAGNGYFNLNGATAVSPTEVLAVGASPTGGTLVEQTKNGHYWKIASSTP